MNNFIKYFLLSFLIFLSEGNLFAQSDTTKVNSKINDETSKGVLKNTNQLKAKFPVTKANPPVNFNLNIDKKLNTNAVNKKLNSNSSKSHANFLMETLPEDRDIITKKYFQGKDVTHQKLVSNFSLGTVNSKTKTVKVECRDYSYVDGDRIRIYVNEKVVSDNIGLKANYYVYYINLDEGYNRIDFQALNQGFSGPNTAEVSLYDANGNLISSKEWNLATGQTATLGVIHR